MAVAGSAKRECKQCGYVEATTVEKKFSRFYLRKNGQVSRAQCKPCFLGGMKEYHKRTYPERKAEMQTKVRERYAANPSIRERRNLKVKLNYIKSKDILNSLVDEAKLSGCSRCSEKDPVCLHLHHTDSTKKDIDVSQIRIGPRTKWTVDMAKEEITKCIVLCANCHCKEHAKDLKAGWKKGHSKFSNALENPVATRDLNTSAEAQQAFESVADALISHQGVTPDETLQVSAQPLDIQAIPAILEQNKEAI
jgi:hypothetical protein